MSAKSIARRNKKKIKVQTNPSTKKIKEKEYNDQQVIFEEDPREDMPEFKEEKGIEPAATDVNGRNEDE